jgi:copper(I)-binding protein
MTNLVPLFRYAVPMLLCMTGNAWAGVCLPQVHDGWIRMLPGGMPMMAGFANIVNPCATPATVVKASSTTFAYTSLHETTLVNGISRMRPVPELRIAPGAAATLKAGGMHLMLMNPTAVMKAGTHVSIEFQLKDGRTIHGIFELRALGE